MTVAMILAGGVGTRFGTPIPKQFVPVLGKPVLVYTLEAFEQHPEIDAILVVCLESYIDNMWDMKAQYSLDKIRWITGGGADYQGSVLNGVDFLSDKLEEKDLVLIHWGASSFIESDLISDCIAVTKEKGNGISTTDFVVLAGLKEEGAASSCQWLDRETVACMASPHGFQNDYLQDIYKRGRETGVITQVEPHTHTLMYALGETIYFSKGSQANIKITNQEDLDLFEGYLLMKQKKESEIK